MLATVEVGGRASVSTDSRDGGYPNSCRRWRLARGMQSGRLACCVELEGEGEAVEVQTGSNIVVVCVRATSPNTHVTPISKRDFEISKRCPPSRLQQSSR